MLEVIEQHRDGGRGDSARASDFGYLEGRGAQALGPRPGRGRSHGYRNAQVTVLAPTGTIGFLMDCDTTGIEPDIALVKYKLLAGGGMLKIVNRTVPPALQAPRLHAATRSPPILAHIEKYDTIEDVIDREDRQDRSPAA